MNSKNSEVSAYVGIMLALLAGLSDAHLDGAYMREPTDGFHMRSKWMNYIKGEAKLSEMALPGTHDSATFKVNHQFIKGVGVTQTLSFEEQMNYGIRVFDIRIRLISDVFVLHHGSFYLEINFGDFLNTLGNFLSRNPTETVLFRLKEEKEPENSTKTLDAVLVDYMHRFPHVIYNTIDTHKLLFEVRGKAVILSDNRKFHNFGLRYSSFDIQDKHKLTVLSRLGEKWIKIEEHLNKTIRGNPNKFYVNYLSASNPSRPFFAASGHIFEETDSSRMPTGVTDPPFSDRNPFFPRVGCVFGVCPILFEGMNILTRNRLQEYNSNLNFQDRTVGIIMADFPGDDLISHIIRNNLLLRDPKYTTWDVWNSL